MGDVFPDPMTERQYRYYEETCRRTGATPFGRNEIEAIVGDGVDPVTASQDIAGGHSARDGAKRITAAHVLPLIKMVIYDLARARANAEWRAACIEAVVAAPLEFNSSAALFARAMNGGRMLDAYSQASAPDARAVAAAVVAEAQKAIRDCEQGLWFAGQYTGPSDAIECDRLRAEAVRKVFGGSASQPQADAGTCEELAPSFQMAP